MAPYIISTLPLTRNIETPRVLKQAIAANKAIAELKGIAQTIPNQSLLINTLSLQESKDSSEVENIITTHDELFQYDKKSTRFSQVSKEVYHYSEALFYGFTTLKTRPISNNLLVEIFHILTERDSGFRNVPGTTLKNANSGEVVYTPPQTRAEIVKYMDNLEQFINNAEMSNLDPLVKMAIIHHQFESIYPFFDGNGRTGRILNILYLISQGILEIPILYLSRYITTHKAEYYQFLQKVRDEDAWEEWVLFMLTALESTAKQTISTIEGIKQLMAEFKKNLREKAPKLYSHELINTLFSYPYTRIEFLMKSIPTTRLTASKYLNKMVDLGLLELKKEKNKNYYINTKLVSLFTSL